MSPTRGTSCTFGSTANVDNAKINQLNNPEYPILDPTHSAGSLKSIPFFGGVQVAPMLPEEIEKL
jgi:hypothetical protein